MIVVAGESLVDLVPDGPQHLAAHLGGGPFNTARALARLEQPVSFLGAISTDTFGARLRKALEDESVGTGTVIETSAPTTLALAEIGRDGSASYSFYVEGTAAPQLTATQALPALPADLDMLCAGSLSLVLEPIATALTAVVEAAAERDALILIDPNIRASLIASRENYLERLARVLARSHVVKASIEDLAWLVPGVQHATAARALLQHGPATALVTCGSEGALVVTNDAEIRIAAPKAHVVDTIGAGDAFGAGFLASWRRRGLSRDHLTDLEAVVDAAEFACLVASKTCERAGASPPTLSELRG